jgi:6,7-dimethyl-8-ribityllumazine synthase
MAKRRQKTINKKKADDRLRMLVVEARYYGHIADALLKGATAALEEAGAQVDRVEVPGALEIPPAIAIAAEVARNKRAPYDGVVALGCVIQGETFHFDIVAMQSARALIDLSVAQQLPAGNGILTVDNEAQALKRADPAQGNKGGEAARAALALARLKRNLAGRGWRPAPPPTRTGRARPTGAAPRVSLRCRRSTRWMSPAPG